MSIHSNAFQQVLQSTVHGNHINERLLSKAAVCRLLWHDISLENGLKHYTILYAIDSEAQSDDHSSR